MKNYKGFTIRERERRNSSPPDGLCQSWTEVQVVRDRRVLHRCDLIEQAEDWIDRQVDPA